MSAPEPRLAPPRKTPLRLSDRELRIRTLAEWYQDVIDAAAWAEGGSERGSHVLAMSRAWNHPSYREFERLRLEMRRLSPRTYWHFSQRWLYAERKVRLVCPRCQAQAAPAAKHRDHRGNIRLRHKHHGDAVFFRLASVLAPSREVDEHEAVAGLRWMEVRWRGDPFVPDQLIASRAA